jgi:hypothetical protein
MDPVTSYDQRKIQSHPIHPSLSLSLAGPKPYHIPSHIIFPPRGLQFSSFISPGTRICSFFAKCRAPHGLAHPESHPIFHPDGLQFSSFPTSTTRICSFLRGVALSRTWHIPNHIRFSIPGASVFLNYHTPDIRIGSFFPRIPSEISTFGAGVPNHIIFSMPGTSIYLVDHTCHTPICSFLLTKAELMRKSSPAAAKKKKLGIP